MKKLFTFFAVVLVSGIALTGCVDNSISVLNASSVRYTCVVENCADLSHAHYKCELQGCDILNNHSHDDTCCTFDNCTAEGAHQHGKCGVKGCSDRNTHAHNSCGQNNCEQRGNHSHGDCCR